MIVSLNLLIQEFFCIKKASCLTECPVPNKYAFGSMIQKISLNKESVMKNNISSITFMVLLYIMLVHLSIGISNILHNFSIIILYVVLLIMPTILPNLALSTVVISEIFTFDGSLSNPLSVTDSK